jgi:iron complex transport system ATP-binding protein
VKSGSIALTATDVGVLRSGNWLVRDISLQLVAGQVLGVIGPNGAGKSSLLSVLAGDTQPTIGTVLLGDFPVRGARSLQLARRRSVLPQQPGLSFPFTVTEVVTMGRAPWAGTKRETEDVERIVEAIHVADLELLADRRYPTLSGGEQARTSFARVLAQNTAVLLLDEPTAALDLRHQEHVMAIARRCADEGVAVLAVLHDIGLAAAHTDRVLVMSGGRLVATGDPADVVTADLVERVFGLPVDVFRHPMRGGLVVVPRRGRKESILR